MDDETANVAAVGYDPTVRLAKLREPFPEEAIGKLPRAGTQLDYVGHAAVTDRLLEVDPTWTWEPVGWAADGAPLVQIDGDTAVFWIRLTVCGVTRLGVGTVPTKAPEREKQLISDALRNAAMRFGVALDLWSKEQLHSEVSERGESASPYGPTADDLAQSLGYSSDATMRKLITDFYGEAKEAVAAGKIDTFQRQELLDDFGPSSPNAQEEPGPGWLSLGHLNDARERLREMMIAPTPVVIDQLETEPENGQDEPPAPEAKGYDAWNGDELRAECRERGLPVSGNKAALVERLRMSHPAGQPETDSPPF